MLHTPPDSRAAVDATADAAAIRGEQVALLYEYVPVAVLANVVIGVCVVVALQGEVPRDRMAVWALAQLAALVLRLAAWLRVRRRGVQGTDAGRYEALFAAGACATGIVWGVAFPALALSALAPTERWFAYTIVIVSGAGVASAGVFAMAHRPVIARLFGAAILVPAFVFFAAGDAREMVAAALILIFAAFLYRTSGLMSAALRHNLQLRRETLAGAVALLASEERFQSLTKLGADWYWEQDAQFRFTEISGGIADRAGLSPSSHVGKTRWEMHTVGMSKRAWHRHHEQLKRHEVFRGLEISRITDTGDTRVLSISGEPVFDAAGVFTGYRGVGSDITERKRLEAELRALATTDALTGLVNRREFLARLSQQFARHRRNPREACAVLMLDLDHFKRINDHHGHAAGDAVLAGFATLLLSVSRESDVVGRVGGEEFAVLLPGVDLPATRAFAERLRRALAATAMQHDGEALYVTASIGIGIMSADDPSGSAALNRADAAMYRAKAGGRDRIEAEVPDAPEEPAAARADVVWFMRAGAGSGPARGQPARDPH